MKKLMVIALLALGGIASTSQAFLGFFGGCGGCCGGCATEEVVVEECNSCEEVTTCDVC